MLTNSRSRPQSRLSSPVAGRRHGLLCLSIALCSTAWCLSAQAFTVFDPVGSVRTEAGNINKRSDVSGIYWDASDNAHGFLRTASDGHITSIDYPGAVETLANQINRSDNIVGYYQGPDLVPHGFLRTAGGEMTTIDYPGSTETSAELINDKNWITGFYTTVSTGGHYHGFVRDPAGTFTTYDVPGATDTLPESMNIQGWIAGYYRTLDGVNYVSHGFLRDPSGAITTFDVLDAADTVSAFVDDRNEVAGYYLDSGLNYHGFERAPGGTISTLPYDVPGATQTRPVWGHLNHAGALKIDGFAMYGPHVYGYVRRPTGTFHTFDVLGYGTYASGMNATNVTGYCFDSSGVQHGFIGHP
ncbi:MAG TPA: hypothetical protein VGI20_04425 [Rhizomicrobium sp.]|jgi:hypothetical protein